MSSYRNAIRFFSLAFSLALPITASAGTFDVKALIDSDNSRSTGCSVTTPGGIVSGIDIVLTTSGTVTGSSGTVTAVTRQTCANPGLNLLSAPVAVDGGWNVGVSSIGDLLIESHLGADIITMDNVGTPRFVFTSSSGLLSDVQLTPWSWGGGDIVMPHAGRDRAVTPTPPRNIVLNGNGDDWAGNVPLSNGTASSPAWRFISSSAYAGLHDLFFNFQIHTNPAAPTAHDDTYALGNLGGTLTVATLGVLNNDNPNQQPITATALDTPQHGTLLLAPNGGFTYTHDGSLAQQDQFHYVDTGTPLLSNIATVTIELPGSHPYAFTSADNVTFVAGQPNTFKVTVTGKPTPALTEEGNLPPGVTFTDNGDGTGTLSGTPGPGSVGTYSIVFTAEKNKPHQSSQNFTLSVVCGGLTVTNPVVTTGTAGTPFSQTFTQAGGAAPVVFALNSGVLPTGLTLSTAGVLSGTPTQSGSFPITVKATDASGCVGIGPTYNLVIACHTITVTNPVVTTGTVNTPFSQTFTQSGAISGATFALNSGQLPTGLVLNASTGVLSGIPTQAGLFPITVRVTDGQGCVGVGQIYNLVINCQTITVTNPATNTGTVNIAFSQTFTAGNTIGTVTFSTASPLPAGLTLSSAGVLSGTPTQTGTFPIVVKATDANGCFGSGATYSLTIGCQVITVTNPATNTGTVNVAFSQAFTAGNTIGTVTFSTASTLPAGLTLSSAGVLSGTPTQTGTFPVIGHVVDANGCSGNGPTYNLTIGCQVITVNKPATTTGTVNIAFSQSFTATNAIGTVTFTTASTLPTGITLAPNGTLSGTPTQSGTFPIVVTATDANGCTGTSTTYNLVIGCQVITVTNPATTSGTVNVAFSQNFTSSNTIGAVTYTTASTLPTGLSLSTGGVLSGTPTQSGPFSIVVTATDANGCSGSGATYSLVIACQVITVTNPATNTGTVNTVFGQTFTAGNTIGTVTFSLNSGVLPAGLSLSSGGVLSGTPTQTGSFPITVKATDANGCFGVGATYTLTIGCQVITVNNPATTTGTVNAAFSQNFTAGNTVGTVTFTTASTLPAGLTLSTGGVLAGTPTQTGSFPIVVHAVDGNGCSGDGATYTLVIGCQTITVTNPATNTGTVSAPFTVTFTAGNTIGTVSFTTASTLPAGITLNTNGTLAGTPTQTGTFPIVVTATDANGCTGTGATYTLIIGCQVITVSNPATTSSPAGTPLSINFTQTGAIGTATFTTASTLPTGLTLDPDGTLHGTPTGSGPFPIAVTVTDSNGCTGTNPPYTLTLTCPVITVTNPGVSTGTAGVLFSQTFTQSGGQGTITWSETGALPSGISLNTSTGVLSGTTSTTGSFPITVTATDSNGCPGTGSTYNLTINCQTISVTNPGVNTGTVDAAFSQTFTVTGILGTVTWSETGALPAGITLNSGTGVLSGTPTIPGSFPITVTATDTNGCTGTGATYTLTINCQTITVTNPGVTTGTVDAPFSQTFTQTGVGTHTPAVFSVNTGTLPSGLTLSSAGVLSGTPGQPGSFPITVKVTDANGCTGISATYTLVIACQTITVTNPATTTGTAGTAFSQTFTQSGVGTHTPAVFTTASTLPTGFTLSSAGVLSGTTTQHGSFPITVTVTDANGCTGTGASYPLNIACNAISVTNPANTAGTVAAPFSETFGSVGILGTPTYSTASTLPTGLTLHASTGVIDGTPTQPGTFPIVVTVTDSNGCTGTGSTYTLIIACQTITVSNPATTSSPAGTPISINFTQTGAIGTATFTTASTLPTGLTLDTDGTLHGTPTQGGCFPIIVTVTDSNGCTATNPPYTLCLTCPVITVTNPGVSTGTAGVLFSQTFTQSGGIGTITWSKTGTLPSGITLNTSTGVLSGTTSQVGSFPITVTATDSNGCTGSGTAYPLTINCQTITVTNPGVNTGTVDAAFSQTFTATGILGTVTWSETGTLPAGITLNSATGVLSGTPTIPGSFPITVTATDTNGCTGTGATYTLTINCQTITVTPPGVTTGTVDAAFSQTFTQVGVGTHTPAVFTINTGTLPSGLTLSSAGVLSGTPGQPGSFPITVKVTDANGCMGISATYTLIIGCQTITVTNPVTTTGTAGTAFSQNFTQSGVGTHTPAVFTTASTLPTGFTLSTSGVLSGTTTQHGAFPITVTVTDANGCTGTGPVYPLNIVCNTISVTNPVNTSGTVGAAFSETFTSSGILGTATYTTASTLPTGLTLHAATGVLDGTPTQSGSFPITVTATDSNGCTGTGVNYPLVIACNVITVTNPGVNTGTAGTPFSQTFTQSGGNGTIVWSETGSLPPGISLNTSTGALFGTTSTTGSFPITVKATDANGCFGTSSYTLTINCQTISVTNPGVNTVQAGTAFDQAFTATGILGTATWSETGALPTGITLNTTTGHLAGTTNAVGSFPITVTATDSNGCSGTGATYTLTVTCPTITVARTGGGSFPAGIFNTAYTGQSVVASGSAGPFTYAVTVGALPTGLSLSSGGAISGTPTATGLFNFTITATDTVNLCTGSQAFSISIAPVAVGDSYAAASNIVDNTQFVITGGTTVSPATPFVGSIANILANDLPSGGVTATPGTFATTSGGSVTLAADGTFIYTPGVHAGAITSDSFTYTVVSNGVTSAAATVNLTLASRVWYVKNNGAAGNGQSQNPFNTLAAAQAASAAGDIIYVYNGDGLTTGQTAGITLKNNQQLIGEGVALVVNTVVLKAAGTQPQITNAAAGTDVVTLADGNTVKGLTITGATRDGITGTTHAGFTGDTLTIQTSTLAGMRFTTMTGAITVTNTIFSGANGTGLDVSGGTATITLNATNSITANAGKRSVSIQNRPAAAGLITIGASITDNGTGILVNNNASGTIAFTGTQTLGTTTNPGVTLTTNTGTTINFSGTLNITTSTGTALNATGGGTLNVTGTTNVTTGLATTGININGVTVGASGVNFTSVNTTGATTGVALASLGNGNVTISSGTISGGTTGLSLSTLGTSTITLGANAQTLTFTGSTTAISGTTFGTLAVAAGSTVNVSGVTALNLTTGAVSGTFANVTSSGGTNGVNLAAVTGTWGATAGTLTGATGATFNASGASAGTVSWGGAINQANGATAVTISGGHTGSITFSGNVTTSATSTGISISASSGAYNFSDAVANTSTLAGSGAAVTIFNETGGSISFGAGYAISNASPAFKIGGTATNTTANITYSGTMAPIAAGGILLDINSTAGTYSTGTITFNGTTLGGNVGNPTGIRSVINSMTGTLVVNHLNLTANNNSYANTLLSIGGTNTGGNFTFNNLVLSANGTGHTGNGLIMSGGGTLTITATGGSSSIDAGGVALDLNGVALGASTIQTLNSTGGVNGIKLTTVTGSLTINGGAISGNSGTAVLMSGGSPSVSYAGTIASAVAGGPINMSGVTGGSDTFSGAVSSTGGGVSITTNGATVAFTGGLSLSTTTNNAFTATGGGVITATQNNTSIVNTLTTTTGTALNVATTTIGAAGLTFRSITAGTAASGPANAIILNNTGTAAGLTVTGNSGAGTGGTIQKTTGASISIITGTKDLSLSFMNIQNSSAGAINGTGVNGFSLTSCSITGNAGGVNDGQTAAVILTDTTNAVSFVSDTVTGTTGANAFNVELHASAASTAAITTLTVTGGSYSNSAANGGFLIDAKNTSKVGAAFFSGVTFNNNFSKGLQMGQNDNSILGDSTTAPLPAWGGGIPNGSITITGCTFVGNNVAAELDGGTGAAGASGSTYYRFVNNGTAANPIVGIPITTPGTGSSHCLVFANGSDSGGGTYKAFISGNFLGSASQVASGKGNGMRIFLQGQQAAIVTVVNNSVLNCPIGRGIEVSELGRPGGGFGQTQLNVKLSGNTVNPMDSTGFPLYAIYVAADAQGTGTSGSNVKAEIHGNTVPVGPGCDTQCSASTGMIDYETVSGATGTHVGTLFNFSGAGASVSSEIATQNTGTAGKTCSFVNGGTLTLTATPVTTVN